MPVLIPTGDEQIQISRFLAHFDRRINRLIRAKRRLIELLNEQKQAIIQQAVTRGIDPNVYLKPSGIDWLGDVPAHWQVTSVRRLITFITSGSRGWAGFYSDSGDLFIQSGNLSRNMSLNLDRVQRVQTPPGAEGLRTRVAKNDILVCITGALTGNVAFVGEDVSQAYVNQHIALLRPSQHAIEPRFLAYALHSDLGQSQFKLNEYGGTKQGLGLDNVQDVVVPLPGPDEQREIVVELDLQSRRIQVTIDKTNREIDLLREYRTRLIADVVTGKLDVRGVVLPTLDAGEALDDLDQDAETAWEECEEAEEPNDADSG